MKLTPYTKKILENFAEINTGIVIKSTPDGEDKTKVSTIDKDKLIYSQTFVDNIFPVDVCFYNLKSFLSTIDSMGVDSDIEFKTDHLVVSNSRSKTKIKYSDDKHVIHLGKEFTPSAPTFTVKLKQDDIASVLKMASILELPHIRIVVSGGKALLEAVDGKLQDSDKYSVDLGDVDVSGDYTAYIARENIKMIPGDYTVDVTVDSNALFRNDVNSDHFYAISLKIVTRD